MSALFLAASAESRTWHVRPDGSGDAPTIQAAMDSAVAGDDVLLAPGTYIGTLIMKGEVWLRGEQGATSTVLDGDAKGPVITSDWLGAVRVEGLTIRNGNASYGAGINAATVEIRDCVFENNRGDSYLGAFGGAVYCGDATIESCEFINNRANGGLGGGGGGAISSWGSLAIDGCSFDGNVASAWVPAQGGAVSCEQATIRNSVFSNNSVSGWRDREGAVTNASGGAIAGNAVIEDCTFSNNVAMGDSYNTGGAVSGGTISNCLFLRNKACGDGGASGGAVYRAVSITNSIFVENLACTSPSGPGTGGAIAGSAINVQNCTLIGNSGETAEGVGGIAAGPGSNIRAVILYATVGRACDGSATWSCSNLWGNHGDETVCGTDGGGNIRRDPEFCAVDPATTLLFTIQADSPCAPGNHPDGMSCGPIGAAAVGCDAVSVEATTWSRLKSLYR